MAHSKNIPWGRGGVVLTYVVCTYLVTTDFHLIVNEDMVNGDPTPSCVRPTHGLDINVILDINYKLEWRPTENAVPLRETYLVTTTSTQKCAPQPQSMFTELVAWRTLGINGMSHCALPLVCLVLVGQYNGGGGVNKLKIVSPLFAANNYFCCWQLGSWLVTSWRTMLSLGLSTNSQGKL